MEFLKEFLLAFTPLFVAIDVFGILPLFIGITFEMHPKDKRVLTLQSCLTALIVSLGFLFFGKSLFAFIGITNDDLRVGGGILLFLIALSNLMFSQEEQRRAPTKDMAIVPVGIPLILGPASLTTILLLADKHGHWITLGSILLNILIVFIVFSFSKVIIRITGRGGAMAIGKVASLLLLAIAVMMIRVGIKNFLDTM